MTDIVELIPLTGKLGEGIEVKIDSEDHEKLCSFTWLCRFRKFVDIDSKMEAYTTYVDVATGKRIKTSMHRMIMDIKSGDKTRVKHLNGDTLDNRKENLKIIRPKKKIRNLKRLAIRSDLYKMNVITDDSIVNTLITAPLIDNDLKDAPMPIMDPIIDDDEKVKTAIIESTVHRFMENDGLFTSVDISNYIKRELKTWIRNSEVTKYLKKSYGSHQGLNKTNTIVDSIKNIYGSLYFIDGEDPRDYTGADQKAITPGEFDLIVKGGDDGAQVSSDGD